jgi:two-component system sensor histidine kinase YesM
MNRHSLFAKLLVVVVITVIIPFMTSNIVSYTANYNSVMNQMVDLNKGYMTSGMKTAEDFLRQFDRIPASLHSDITTINILSGTDSYNSTERYYIQKALIGMCDAYDALEGVRYISNINAEYFETTRRNLNDSLYTLNDMIQNPIGAFNGITFYADDNGRPILMEYTTDLVNVPYTTKLGSMTIYLNYTLLESLKETLIGKQEKGHILLYLGEENQFAYSSCSIQDIDLDFEVLYSKGVYQGELNGIPGVFIVSSRNYKGSPVNLIKFIGNSSMRIPAKKALFQTLILQTAALILVCAVLLMSTYALLKPIKRIIKNMERVEMGEFSYHEQSGGKDELAVLEQRYGQMIKSMDTLINRNYRYALENTKAKLKVLQAQINPHFLYNSLQYISTTALKAKAFEVSEQIAQLGCIFKYNMDTKKEVVTVEDELTHIENYIALQQGRYGNRMRFSIDCDPEALSIQIPKMIMQPLIENSIVHGMEKSTGNGSIHLEIRKKESLIIRVIDNGRGISREMISKIEKEYNTHELPSESVGIGLVNVLQRLQIYTRGKFQWKVTSTPMEETIVELRIETGESNESAFG